MNELHKLRTDNVDLLNKLDATSLDALDLLQSQIADQKCINSSLQVIEYFLMRYLIQIKHWFGCVFTFLFLLLH